MQTRIKALVMLDDPHPQCDVGILLPLEVKKDRVQAESDVWKIEK